MSATSLIAVLFVVSIIGIPVGLVFWCAAQIEKLGKSLSDKYPGLSATYQHSKTTKGMIISLPCSGPRVFIHREGVFERFGKASGLSSEIQSGDIGFDRDFYIDTESHAVVKEWLQSAEVREALVNLFRLGIAQIKCEMGYLTTWGPLLFKTLRMTAPQLEAVARNLSLLSRELGKAASSAKPEPVVLGSAPRVDASRLQVPKSASWIVSCVIIIPLLLGFLFAYFNRQNICIPIYGWEDYMFKSWPYWVSSILIFAVYLFPLVKGHSKGHESFFAILAFAAGTHLFAVINIYEFINFTKDSSQSRVYQLNLLQAYARRPARGSEGSSVIRLSPVELGGSDLELTLRYSPRVWDIRLVKGAEITMHDGYLGIPYAIEVIPIYRDVPLY